MSDAIKHECGIVMLRLKKDLNYYVEKYGTALYGLNKMYLLMEKQFNRGQDGAGLANIKFDMNPGQRYISRQRSISSKPIADIFSHVNKRFKDATEHNPELLKDVSFLKENVGFSGELFLGHLRYGTFGRNSIENCHPFLRQSNWMTKNLVVAGNFNLTNVNELFSVLTKLGQHPKEKSDTVTVMEKIGHFLDEENDTLYNEYKTANNKNPEVYNKIAQNLDIGKILRKASADWDGGYAMTGLFGHGDAFVLRDPNGIRPAYWYEDEEVCVVTSERPVIQTAFQAPFEEIKEVTPGHALIVKKDGRIWEEEINPTGDNARCSFERIYFSRGNDKDIYNERKMMGDVLVPKVLKAIDGDLENSVFSFIPNTAETSYYGMIKGLEDELNIRKIQRIKTANLEDENELKSILLERARVEKLILKDAKLRTFISQDEGRNDLVANVYDITHGTLEPGKDNLVVIDDSIVRGTTLKQSILRILDRLQPKKIVVASAAPQIRYPDCYGIDMAKMGDFIAFQAAVALLNERNMNHILDEVYEKCVAQSNLPKEEIKNYVQEVYAPFSEEEVSQKISELLTPHDLNADVEIVFQSVKDLHRCCPENPGDWYFTGNYPTPGGNRVVNRAFMNYMEGKNVRAY